MKVIIIRVSGEEETHDVARERVWPEITALLGAPMLDTVNLRDGRVMLVDDGGYETTSEVRENVTHLVPTKPLKPVNAKATAMYHAICHPGTTHQIVGDVAIVNDEDFPE